MRFLIDENLALSFAAILQSLGYDAAHVSQLGLNATDDAIILDYAGKQGYIVITFDLDFSRLIAIGNLQLPSLITFRMDKMSPLLFRQIMEQHLGNLQSALMAGAMVTITKSGIRVKQLPVR
ncbi:MAG: DUF5615 family PIN-like protein [Bacteroidota bacterium]